MHQCTQNLGLAPDLSRLSREVRDLIRRSNRGEYPSRSGTAAAICAAISSVGRAARADARGVRNRRIVCMQGIINEERFGPLSHLVCVRGCEERSIEMEEAGREEKGAQSRSRSVPLPNLRNLRQGRGYTQRQLSELAGVAHTSVQQLETAKRGGYPRTIRRIADALGVSPQDLRDRPLE